MARRKQKEDPGLPWTPWDPDPWPGDDPGDTPLMHEEDKTAEFGEKFARYATAIVLGCMLVILVILTAKFGIWLWDVL